MSDILIENGLIARAAQHLGEPGLTAIVTDENVARHWLKPLQHGLEAAGHQVVSLVLKPGEGSKNLQTYGQVLGFLADSGLTRADLVIALGGGVVGDVTGFAAATYLRGVRLAQVPTSLLAQVDSSVGGKTGIDLPQGKNLAGAFYQPRTVLVDPDTLNTLPGEHYRDGLSEVVKYGAIVDAQLLNMIPYDGHEQADIIRRCIDIKRDIVSRDVYDRGERQLLNFGHTIGHAVERASGYAVTHGQAVAIGMAVMARASYRMGLCTREDAGRLQGLLSLLGLPTVTDFGEDTLFDAMLMDKKRGGQQLTLVVMHALGDCRLKPVTLSEARNWLKEGMRPW